MDDGAEQPDAPVLVVDDDVANVELVVQLLETAGFQSVASTTDSREVLGLLEARPADLIALDLTMPHLNGFDLMREIRRREAPGDHVPILVLTADVTLATKRRALAAGASDFVTKPFDTIEVVLRAKNLLRTHHLQLELRRHNEALEEEVRARTEELRILAADLARLDRTKSDMIQILSHELFTPVSAIQGAALSLAHHGASIPAGELEALIQGSNRATSRIRRLIANLQATASLDRAEVEIETTILPIGVVLNGVAGDFLDDADRLELPDGRADLELRADVNPELGRRALAVLVENALDVSPHETSVEISVLGSEPWVDVSVADRGPGIAEDELRRIFGAFVLAEPLMTRTHEGLGIGLYLARRIMDAHHGEIACSARLGGGSIFTLRFPRLKARDAGVDGA
jgi:signal transduction histidine kinase